MKLILLSFIFALFFSSASAQYGKLEQLREWDTTNVVLRTPKATLVKLLASKEAVEKKKGKLITEIERQLEIARGGFIINRTTSINTSFFSKYVKALQDLGVDTSYYIQEFFIYYPRPYQRVVQ